MLRITVLTVLILMGGQGSSAPSRDSVYRVLPDADREQFRAAFERTISLQIEGRWSDLYETLDTERIPLTKEQFVKKMNDADRLMRFVPASITFIPPSDDWEVEGCAEFKKLAKNGKGVVSSVEARRTPAGWRFGPVAIELRKDEPNGVRSCSLAD